MTADTQVKLRLWKWVLIVSCTIVLAGDIAVHVSPAMRRDGGVSALAAIPYCVAVVFLLFGSPFLVRSQRWLAIAGWVIGAMTILCSGL